MLMVSLGRSPISPTSPLSNHNKMESIVDNTIPAVDEQEYTFGSSDSTIEQVDTTWTITDAISEKTNSPKGTGERHILTFESPDFPFPVTVRQFVTYDSANGSDTSWLNRSRGVLKSIAKAALGKTAYKLSELVGAKLRARTREDSDGFATLSRFRAVANGNGNLS